MDLMCGHVDSTAMRAQRQAQQGFPCICNDSSDGGKSSSCRESDMPFIPM
jgi:hypothetical protein